MDSNAFEALKTLFQLISCIFAIHLNCVLIYLIVTKSPTKMGTYRFLMCYFCCISITFAALEIVLKPSIHSQGSAFFMVADLRNWQMPMWVGRFLVCMLCACCGVTMYGIAIHFVYRLFALERLGRLRYFKGAYLLFWFSIPILAGMNWIVLCWFLLSMNPVSDRYLRPIIEDIFHIPIEHAVYSAAIFWPTNLEGAIYFNWYSGAGLINLLLSMGFAFSVVVVAGAKSWMKTRHLRKQGESKFTRNLQMQLYKALVAQTLIPVFLLFLPFAVLFVGPLLFIDCEFLSVPLTFIYALYPALDPIPILFFVDNYRITISKFFYCCFGCKKNQVIDSGGSEYKVQNSDRTMSNNFLYI